jgi:flagellar L-ring protein FlgH
MIKTSALCLLCACWISLHAANPRHFSLYGDKKAKRIDDVITVIIIEEAQAMNKNNTNSNEQSDVGFETSNNGNGIMRFLPSWGFGGKNNTDYSGKGETTKKGQLTAKVTARIVEVQDNGNLLIQGSKMVEINNEREVIHVAGVIRPEDILADNTVFSSSIADAKITYTGDGSLSDASKPGVLTRFFQWIF